MTDKNKFTVEKELLNQVKYNDKGLVPAVAQNAHSGEILMLAYMNKESLQKTLDSGNATFWSRSRQKLWMKGETSGNVLQVQAILLDCDEDTLVLLVNPAGPTCHTGERSCFHRILAKSNTSQESGCGGCGGCCG